MAVTATVGTQATAHSAGTKLDTDKLAGRLRVSSDSATLAAAADANSTVKLCWIPYGATILDGHMVHSATNTSVTTTGGINGVSGTTYDYDVDLFWAATATATAAESRSAPKVIRKLAAASTTPGYKVTDPLGANILVTIGGATANVNSVFQAAVYWVMD